LEGAAAVIVRAAVLRDVGAPLCVEEITLGQPGPGQVRVRMVASGVCHSDLSLARGILPQRVPAVLGHEGTGRVVAVGEGVTTPQVGDAVLLNWAPPCRQCWWCRHGEPFLCEHAGDASAEPYALLDGGTPLYAGLGVAAFASETVVAQSACIPLPGDLDLEEAALIGCALLTGVGAVMHAAAVQPGESVAVIGLGGVGLCAVQGARLAGAAPIVAVDTSAERAHLALRLGATDVVEPGADAGKHIRALTGGRGVDHAIECVGRAETIRTAWSVTRRGGHATVVGLGARTDMVSFNALEVAHFARTLRGSMYGNSDPAADVPGLLEHVRAGRLDLGALVTGRITLDDVEPAFADLNAGRGARSLIVFGGETA
jgi:S-(hydroxymethyl)glutathione dehydrogenase/alcohol dehydrogenase